MRRHVRAFAIFSLLVLIVAACSKPKQKQDNVGASEKGQSALTQAGGPKASAAGGQKGGTAGGAISVGGPAVKGYGALNPGADQAQAAKVGALIHLQSTGYSNPNTWTGVTKDTIKLNFGLDKTGCGVNLFDLLSKASANTAKETRFYQKAPSDQTTVNTQQYEAIKDIIDYWNIHVADVAADVPQAVQVMKQYNTPGHLFYGRKLTYDTVDAGSFQCQDKQTSAALQMRDSTHPFSAVVYDVPGLYENGVSLASAMQAKISADKRPMIFGLLDTSDKFLSNFQGYAWDEFQSITRQSQLGAQWVCQDLKGTGPNAAEWGNGKAVNAVDTTMHSQARKFGLVYAQNPNSNQAAAEFKADVQKDCGITFSTGGSTGNVTGGTEFPINDNPARAADEGNTIATRFKQAHVTTVIYLIDFLGAFFHIIDFHSQNYKPEFAEIGTAWDTATVQRLSPDQDEMQKSSMFYTWAGVQGFGWGPDDPFWVYHATHQVYPGDHKPCDPRTDVGMNHGKDGSAAALYCKAPTAMGAWYYSWLPLIGGMIFAGPNLTPHTVDAGLAAYPETRYGLDGPTTDPVAVLVGAGPNQYYFVTDGSSARWRADYVSPPPERVLGFPDYPDCQRHYTAFDSQLAPQWERGGPNYSAWCGSSKYTTGWTDEGKSVTYTPSTASGKTCADSPTKACARDDYPRWEPVHYK